MGAPSLVSKRSAHAEHADGLAARDPEVRKEAEHLDEQDRLHERPENRTVMHRDADEQRQQPDREYQHRVVEHRAETTQQTGGTGQKGVGQSSDSRAETAASGRASNGSTDQFARHGSGAVSRGFGSSSINCWRSRIARR